MLRTDAAVVESTLTASLSYGRYALRLWAELAEPVRGIICTRLLQAPLPLNVLLTSGDERPWRRLQLANANANGTDFTVSIQYSRQVLYFHHYSHSKLNPTTPSGLCFGENSRSRNRRNH